MLPFNRTALIAKIPIILRLIATVLMGNLSAQTNLALNKPASASSIQKDLHIPGNAVDGIDLSGRRTWYTATRWSSDKDLDGDDSWFMVDLENTHTINHVVIKWEWAFARSFDILVSTNKANYVTGIDGCNKVTFPDGDEVRWT